MIRAFTAAAGALALVAVPTIAAAEPAAGRATAPSVSALSLSPAARAGTTSKRSSKLSHRGAIIAGVLAAGVVAGGIIAISKDDDKPDSP